MAAKYFAEKALADLPPDSVPASSARAIIAAANDQLPQDPEVDYMFPPGSVVCGMSYTNIPPEELRVVCLACRTMYKSKYHGMVCCTCCAAYIDGVPFIGTAGPAAASTDGAE